MCFETKRKNEMNIYCSLAVETEQCLIIIISLSWSGISFWSFHLPFGKVIYYHQYRTYLSVRVKVATKFPSFFQ